MHTAFDCYPIVERLPLVIQSIATSGDKLLIGTKEGHLLVYNIIEEVSQTGKKFQVHFSRSNKTFGKKAVKQLNIYEKIGVIFSLSDEIISVHDSNSYSLKFQFPKSKGVKLYAVDNGVKMLRLGIVTSRKVQTFYWNKNEFSDLHPELNFPETPKKIAWIGDYICVGMRKEYILMRCDTGDIIELFDTGIKKSEPLIANVPTGELALCRDEVTVFLHVSKKGEHTDSLAVTWSDTPLALEFIHPYIIAALPKYIEICSLNPRHVVQRIEAPNATNIVVGSYCYIASPSHTWRLCPVDVNKQIDQLIEEKEYEMALTLTELMDEVGDKKKNKMKQIKKLLGFSQFCQRRFEEAIKLFNSIDEDPSFVIGLFPNLLPKEFHKRIKYPSTLPNFSDGDIEKGLKVLIDYLTAIRRNAKQTQQSTVTSIQQSAVARSRLPSVLNSQQSETSKSFLCLIDTTLLKCYLQVNDNLIAPLLRLSNHCHVEECENALVQKKKFNELVLLYQSNNEHEKALNLLLDQSDIDSSPLKGPTKTIEYLQKLGESNLSLIFKYSIGVLEKYPNEALTIFTNDTQEIEQLPRDRVLEHLKKHAPSTVTKYLEHIIFDWKETKSEFHNRLVSCYIESIIPLMRDYLISLRSSDKRAPAGKEPGKLGDLRARLLFFLEHSTQYQPSKLFRYFPQNILHEERALLYGREKRHEEALAIYIYILKDRYMAEQHCHKIFSAENCTDESDRNVYLSLAKMYLHPEQLPSLTAPNSVFNDVVMNPDLQVALDILCKYAKRIEIKDALELLPSYTKIKDILAFLTTALKDKVQNKHSTIVRKNLIHAEYLQIYEQQIYYQSTKCEITEERNCLICHKRIGTSAFARYPPGFIVHYFCWKGLPDNTCPPNLFDN
ncbi:vam6/Vps39-like protein isoform X1 [Hydra vulgaris]|nr:vam6/Vps39-like protein [Hydra vulgaris]